MAICQKSRIAVVGLGRMGRLHIAHLAELWDCVHVVAVCNSQSQSLQKVAARFSVAAYTDFATMLDHEKPEAVVIATPAANHPTFIAAAAARGTHVFCEKPLALSREEAHAVARIVADHGVLFQIGFQRRFDRAYRDAHKKIRDGLIGDPITFKSVARDTWQPDVEYARLEVSGGLLLDMAIHDFDLARWLMGSEVCRVSTLGNNLLYPELAEVQDIDNAVVNLEFQSGAIGNIEASRSGTYGYDIRSEIVGTRGALFMGPIEDTAVVAAGRDGFRRKAISGFEERFLDSYRLEMKEFVDCLREKRLPECGMEEGLLSLEIALAARESLYTKAPVSVARSK